MRGINGLSSWLNTRRARIRRHPHDTARFEGLEPRLLLAANPVISEFMTSNDSTLPDGNLPPRFADWIEVHNAGDMPADLAGWHLTDDPLQLDKWTFPSVMLPVDGYLIVFASGDNNVDPGGNIHTNFRLDADGDYFAMVRPDMSIASEFGPGGTPFPLQFTDVSYGLTSGQDATLLVGPATQVHVLVPGSGDATNYGDSWKGGDEAAFADAGGLTGWTSGTTAPVGFDADAPVIHPDVIAYWTFDEVDQQASIDQTGHGHDAALIGGDLQPAAGRFGGAVLLDGLGDYVQVDDHDDLEFAAGESFSISLWYKADVQNPITNDGLITKGYHTSTRDPNGYYQIQLTGGSGQIAEFDSRQGSGDTPRARLADGSATDIVNDQWHHIVFVRDMTANELRMYVNGTATTGSIATAGGGWAMGVNSSPLIIGNHFNRFTEGLFDDIALFHRALTGNQVANLLSGARTPLTVLNDDDPPPGGGGLSVAYNDPAGGWDYGYDGATAANAATAALDGTFRHDNGSDEWDGTAIGTGRPGGASALTDGPITYLRVQDTGDPSDHGFADPGSNRKILFAHDLTPQGLPANMLDAGVTLAFRARISTGSPLDNAYPDGGGAITAWPAGGDGYAIHDGGKGNFILRQSNGGSIAFSLALPGDSGAGSGLITNNLNGAFVSGTVDTGEAGTRNLLPVTDPTQWHEFWVTIQGGGSGTHVVSIYVDGSTTPAAFFTTAGNGSDYSGFSYLGIGAGSTGQRGAVDVDYVAVKSGVHTPTAVGGGGGAAEADAGGGSGGEYAGLINTDVQDDMYDVNASAWIRVPFNVADPAAFDSLTLRMKYDDGFVAYINGVEVASRNAPAPGGLSFDSTAMAEHLDAQALVFESIPLDYAALQAGPGALVAGANILAIHGLNLSAADGDFLIQPELVASTATTTVTRYFSHPTPGAANDDASAFLGYVADTKFSVNRGFYDAPFDVAITSDTPGAMIYYTTNGSTPSPTTGTLYTGPIHIAGTTTLRAMAARDGYVSTDVDTHTYLFLNQVIGQPNNPVGFPSTWGNPSDTVIAADYELDPNVTQSPLYSGQLIDALTSLPTLSLVMNVNDWFHPQTGIYSNAERSGVQWERAVSAELMFPERLDGFNFGGLDLGGFAVNAGIRMQGGTSTDNFKSPKFSMRLLFKDIYGPGTLDYKLFRDSDIDSINTLVLDARLNQTWIHPTDESQRTRAQYVRDQVMNDLQNAMGHLSPHGTYAHVYINGLYWGLYDMHERPDDAFIAEHTGGERANMDVIKHTPNDVVAGSNSAYNSMLSFARGGLADAGRYAQLQTMLDVPAFIDYMLLNIWAGNDDWAHHNWYAGRDRGGDGLWRFYSWDAEHVMKSEATNVTSRNDSGGPTELFQLLRQNADFRLLFADHAQRHFFNDGVLTPQGAQAVYDARIDEIDPAIIMESARWGDHRESVSGQTYTRNNQWLTELNRIRNTYLPGRTATVLNQLRSIGLYPTVDAPQFNQHGGEFSAGFELEMTAAASSTFVDTDLVPEFAPVRAHVPGNGTLGLTWTQVGFDDTSWQSGISGVGYEDSPSGYASLIGLDMLDEWNLRESSIYTRFTFNVANDFDPGDFDAMTLRLKYEDGFVAYLNGVLVAQGSAPGVIQWDSLATSTRSESAAVQFQEFDLTSRLNLLQPGQNVLAIQGLNVSRTSSDLLVLPELVLREEVVVSSLPIYFTTDGSDPRQPNGSLAPAAMLYDEPVPLGASTHIKARVLTGGTWSALTEATFTLDQPLPIRITEIHYNPFGADDTEFIELKNIGPVAIDLTGVRFTDGIEFDFTGSTVTSLLPGQYVLIVANQAAFETTYNTMNMHIAGQFANGTALNNAGERIVLVDRFDSVIHDFVFSDMWVPLSDGVGYSLDVIDAAADPATWADDASWRPSGIPNGTPGRPDPIDGALPGDANYNGVVDIADLSIVAISFGATGTLWHQGNFNGDAVTNITDLSILAGRFGQAGMMGGGDAAGQADSTDLLTETTSSLETTRRRVTVTPKSPPLAATGADILGPGSWRHIRSIVAETDPIARIV